MKKFCILIIFNSYLFACSDLGCRSNGPNNPCTAVLCSSNASPCYGYKCSSNDSPCYGYKCTSNGAPCYGDECFANGAACYGNNCRSNGGNLNPLDQSTINQFNNVVFTKQQFEDLPENERNKYNDYQKKEQAEKLTDLQQQLATTTNNLTKIKLNLLILNLQNQIDPNSMLTNSTTTLNTIKTLIPTPVPANLQRFSNKVDQGLKLISQMTSQQMQMQQQLIQLLNELLIV